MTRANESGCPDSARWIDFYGDALDEITAESLREHLSTCPRCLELAQDARQFVNAMERPEFSAPARQQARPRHHAWLVAAAVLTALFLVPWLLHDSPVDLVIERPAYQPGALNSSRTQWRDAAGESSFAAAMELYQARDDRAAERALESHLAVHPADDSARFYLAMTRLQLGHDADAIVELTRLIETENHSWHDDARWYRALAWQRTGESARARTEFESIADGHGPHAIEASQRLERTP